MSPFVWIIIAIVAISIIANIKKDKNRSKGTTEKTANTSIDKDTLNDWSAKINKRISETAENNTHKEIPQNKNNSHGHVDRDPTYTGAAFSFVHGMGTIRRLAEQAGIFEDRINEEAIYFLHTIFKFTVFVYEKPDCEKFQKIESYVASHTDGNKLHQREVFYAKIIRNEYPIRCEWNLSGNEMDNNNPYIRAWSAFGDMVVNPQCADDYENAPVVLWGIDEIFKLFPVMTGILENVVIPLVDEIKLTKS